MVSTVSATLCFFQSSRRQRHLHSFPTRRSSDLSPIPDGVASPLPTRKARPRRAQRGSRRLPRARRPVLVRLSRAPILKRSEEHTSELQSREKLVCRLLLEKKKHAPSFRTPQRHT